MLPSFREMELLGDTVRVVETGEPYLRRVTGTFEIEARKIVTDLRALPQAR